MSSFKSQQFGKKQIKPAEKVENVVNYGLWHLAKRDHSIHELREKLGRKTDNEEWIEETIEKLIGLGYLNDRRYVENYLKEYNEFKQYGPSRIKQEFRQKGIDNNIVKEVMEETEFDYFESALKRLNRKYREPIEDRKERDKATRYMITKGFGFDMIKYALEDHLKDKEEE